MNNDSPQGIAALIQDSSDIETVRDLALGVIEALELINKSIALAHAQVLRDASPEEVATVDKFAKAIDDNRDRMAMLALIKMMTGRFDSDPQG